VVEPLGFLKVDHSFWFGKKVLLTGHTGFKGAWMTLMLDELGAKVFGFSDNSVEPPSMFEDLSLGNVCVNSELGDIRDLEEIKRVIAKFKPEIVIHMAAQSIVAIGYSDPLRTFTTNVLGTLNLLEAIKDAGDTVRTVVCITSDKSYENLELGRPFVETDPLGGVDPYSGSKSASEIVINSYRASFFDEMKIPICTARAGNVIGGGDWSKDRLIPDAIRSFYQSKVLEIRNPLGVRPWQHVLEPNLGYLNLAMKSYGKGAGEFSSAWNFGPAAAGNLSVSELLELVRIEIPGLAWANNLQSNYKEAKLLTLSSNKAKNLLGWETKLTTKESIKMTIDWYLANQTGADMKLFTRKQITDYFAMPTGDRND
jgi:CDP-glucose 4,6-dehydratase